MGSPPVQEQQLLRAQTPVSCLGPSRALHKETPAVTFGQPCLNARTVVRSQTPKRYGTRRNLLKKYFNATFKDLDTIGRGGLYNYNSMDHSMMMAILSVRNLNENANHDLWAINTDEEYADPAESARE